MNLTAQNVFETIERYIEIKVNIGSSNMPLSREGIAYAELQEANAEMKKLVLAMLGKVRS